MHAQSNRHRKFLKWAKMLNKQIAFLLQQCLRYIDAIMQRSQRAKKEERKLMFTIQNQRQHTENSHSFIHHTRLVVTSQSNAKSTAKEERWKKNSCTEKIGYSKYDWIMSLKWNRCRIPNGDKCAIWKEHRKYVKIQSIPYADVCDSYVWKYLCSSAMANCMHDSFLSHRRYKSVDVWKRKSKEKKIVVFFFYFFCFFFLLSSHTILRTNIRGGSLTNKWEKKKRNAFTKINSSCRRHLHYSTLCNWHVKVHTLTQLDWH